MFKMTMIYMLLVVLVVQDEADSQCPQKWGSICQYNCTGCNNNCDANSGCSNGCSGLYFQFYNNENNGYECKSCTSSCAPCNDQSPCKLCKQGYYGNTCSQQCRPECTTCTDYNVCQTCSPKYYGSYCQGSCRLSCATCTAWNTCQTCVNGKWGSYCQYSCDECKHNYCSKNSGCYYGCNDRYFAKSIGGGRICKPCPTHCEKCSSDNLCSRCDSGYNGTTCQYNCHHCNADLCDENTGDCTIQCTASQFFANNQLKCINCPNGCSSCSSPTECSTCNNGRWGQMCQYTCSNCINLVCSKYDGRCTSGCRDNYFGYKCTKKCMSECKTCSSGNICSTCKSNRFHQDDSKRICDCTDEYCTSKNGETCIDCSLDSWYPRGRGCCPCGSNCLNSLCQNDGTCTECETGKHGTHCNEACAKECQNNICHRNGTCISCKEVRYGPTCNLYCSHTITHCYLCYGQYHNDTVCTRCYTNFNRYAAGKQCKLCISHCKPRRYQSCYTTTGACYEGCQDGWVGDKCDMKCSVQYCEICSTTDPNECAECVAGFYLNGNNTCDECPGNCKEGTVCNKYSGVCSEGCVNGFSGGHCNITCLPGCRQCARNNASSCSVCKYTFYGQSCDLSCSDGCVTQNQSQTCNKLDGTCDFGCKDGLWDRQCDKHCGGCSKTACNRTTGYCLSPCHYTHYGKACDSQCSKNCITSTERSCYEIDGFCRNGCQRGWFGRQCKDHCSENCKGNICDRNTGVCISGCIGGFKGSTCMQALQSDDSSGPNAAAIGGGVGAAVAVLVIVVLIVVVVVLRRRLARANAEREHPANVDAAVSHCKATDEINLKPAPDYQNLAIGTSFSTDRQANDSIECTSTYQELNQDTRDGTEYSTLDEITPT